MNDARKYDLIIVGSGAGGAAAAYHLTQSGAHVLLLEKGERLPQDGSTLDPARVMRRGEFLAREPWLDRTGAEVFPEEHFNLGGKTKWYGAALIRFAPEEFHADPASGYLPWPVGYDELAPFYTEAERLLGVRAFTAEPDITRIADGLRQCDPNWRSEGLKLGLAQNILSFPEEYRHYDGFASVRGLKSDAESSLLARLAGQPNLDIRTGQPVVELLPNGGVGRVAGVLCADGSRYFADAVILAAGALHSPRLLAAYLRQNGLNSKLPGAHLVGRYYKSHLLTAMLALSRQPVRDQLGKTLLLTHRQMPRSSVQTLGGSLAADIMAQQLPGFVPGLLKRAIASRAQGFFLQTEDVSHADNRVWVDDRGHSHLDYDPARSAAAWAEHRRLVATLRGQLLRQGYVAFAQDIGVTGTAHACGTLVAGRSAESSVVSPEGLVWGLDNLYVADGSILPRSSRVNPALTIYAWGLRVASLIAGRRELRHVA